MMSGNAGIEELVCNTMINIYSTWDKINIYEN